MTAGLNHSSDSVTGRSMVGDAVLVGAPRMASIRIGCWRLTRNRPVDMLKVSGTALRRSAPRQRAIVAIVGPCVKICYCSLKKQLWVDDGQFTVFHFRLSSK